PASAPASAMRVRSSSSTSGNDATDGATGLSTMVAGFEATAGSAVAALARGALGFVAAGAGAGEGAGAATGAGTTAGFWGEDLGGGALGAAGAAGGLGTAGRGPVATGIFFTSGRCADEGERVDDGAFAALGELGAVGAGRGVPVAGGGALGMTSFGSTSTGGAAAETSLGASSGAGGGSLPGSASPSPGTLETWIT